MSYQWRPASGSYSESALDAAGLLPIFDSQAEAEQWLGLFWSDLLTEGVAEVALWDGDRLVHPPMGLDR